MSDGANGEIRYTTKELLAKIESKIDGLLARIDEDRTETQREIAEVKRDFSGFERRFSLHEREDGHPGTMVRLAAVEAAVLTMQTNAAANQKLDDYIDKAGKRDAEQRRWLIGLSITVAVTLGVTIARSLGLIL